MAELERRERRMDLRFGTLAVLIAEPNRDREKRPAPYQPADFFRTLPRVSPAQSEEEHLQQLAAAFGVTLPKE